MIRSARSRHSAALALASSLVLALGASRARAQAESPAPAESALVKLLKKAPEARVGAIIDVVGKRGTADDLTYLLSRAVDDGPAGFPPAARRQALDALADAAATRNARPSTGGDAVARLITPGSKADAATRLAATRLAGVYRLPAAVPALVAVVEAKQGVDDPTRDAALAALAQVGDAAARAAIERSAGPSSPPATRRLALARLAGVDLPAAADRAAEAVAAAAPGEDLAPLLAAFLDRQGGPEKLLDALNRRPPPPDAAKLALRAVQALGRSDEALVAALGKAAGIEADPGPPTPAAMATLIAEVAEHGDPARGERVFRQAGINCTQCHAIAGAGGDVGPDLSSLGLSSPVDYVVNSILIPDQAIKEEYQTRVIQTDDGRVLQGIVAVEDERRVILKDAKGERITVPVASIEESRRGGSLMPKGLTATLTRAEFVDLVRFLSELGRPGPYAIRPTPTIQRWRVLRPYPADLGSSPESIRSEVLEAEPSRWSSVYAWTSGDLPITEVVAGGAPALIQGEINVTSGGPMAFRIGAGPSPRVEAWIDDQALAIAPDGTATATLASGSHRLTLRLGAESKGSLRVEVTRGPGSPAEFTVVGGR